MCPGFHKKQGFINPGYEVAFFCGIQGRHDGNPLPAKTPEQCAKFCEWKTDCIGSSWRSDTQQFLLSGDYPSKAQENTIYMHDITKVVMPETHPSYCRHCTLKLEECEQSKAPEELSGCLTMQRLLSGRLDT